MHNTTGLRPNTISTTPTTSTNMSFNILHSIHSATTTSEDDDTVQTGVSESSTRLLLMVSSTQRTPDGLLTKVRQLLDALTTKIPSVKIIKWDDNIYTGKKPQPLDNLPEEVEAAEPYLQNFSRFSSSEKGYFRVQVIHPSDVPSSLILETGKTFNISKQQAVSLAPSEALYPQTVGLLIGTTEAMLETKDMYFLLTRLSQVSVLGFTWKYINTGDRGKFDMNQRAIYVETETLSAKKLESFFTRHFNEQQNQLFGTSLTFLPTSTYPTPSQKTKIKKYAPIQTKLMTDMRSYSVEFNNFHQFTPSQTNSSQYLLEALLNTDSINAKKVVRNKKAAEFYGRVFYSGITNYESKLTTFQYPAYNETEASSILRALPLFLQDHFGINHEEVQTCRTDHVISAQQGQWTSATRTFLSPQDLREQVQFENLQMVADAELPTAQFISADHERAMTGIAPNDNATTTTNLNAPTPAKPTAAAPDDTSELTDNTGSTRTSKAKQIAAKQVKAIAQQYLQQQNVDKNKIEEQEALLSKQQEEMKELKAMMRSIMTQKSNHTAVPPSPTLPNNTPLPPSDDEEDDVLVPYPPRKYHLRTRTSAFLDTDDEESQDNTYDPPEEIEDARMEDNESSSIPERFNQPPPKRKQVTTNVKRNKRSATASSTRGGALC